MEEEGIQSKLSRWSLKNNNTNRQIMNFKSSEKLQDWPRNPNSLKTIFLIKISVYESIGNRKNFW